ncbi:methylmalonyl epimerase [Rhexocercosporidium sp. MPI-PUGE-AT-0058]|nr:methylmalonyl epimerase [Rhexocercosporidium sp. MPI-PUGE-AT-0058]
MFCHISSFPVPSSVYFTQLVFLKTNVHTQLKNFTMDQASVESPAALAAPFLGNVVEICIVTADHKRTIDSLLKLGIGPFQIHHFTPSNVSQQTFRGKPASFELIVCFATQGSMIWEIMQPVSGPSIMAEFLERKGEGIHHVAFDCNHVPPEKRREDFEKRGFSVVQEGVWKGKKGSCEFLFFDTEGEVGTCFESYRFSEDWEDPEDTIWYPARE